MSEQQSMLILTSALYLLTFAALVAAIQAWIFCFRGKTSVKNQLVQLQTRIAELESTVGGQGTPDPKPQERDTRHDRVMGILVAGFIFIGSLLLAMFLINSL